MELSSFGTKVEIWRCLLLIFLADLGCLNMCKLKIPWMISFFLGYQRWPLKGSRSLKLGGWSRIQGLEKTCRPPLPRKRNASFKPPETKNCVVLKKYTFFRFRQNHDQLFLSILLTFSVLSFVSFARMQFIQKHFCEHSQPIYVALTNFARKLLHKLFCKSFAASTLAFGELSNIELPTYQRSGLHHLFQTIISLGSLSSIFQVVIL